MNADRRTASLLACVVGVVLCAPTVAAAPRLTPSYPDHRNLLIYLDDAGNEHPVRTPEDWAIRRAHVLEGMQQAMGPLPDMGETPVPLDVEMIREDETDRWTLWLLSYVSEPGDRVPAYLFIPRGVKFPVPAVLCLHQTTDIGKAEPAGLGPRENMRYARELAERGYVTLAPDYPSFGDRADYDFAADDYVSGTMKAIWDNMRAVDLLCALDEVDPERIGAIGHSLGGHNAMFTAAFDERIGCVVSSCGFTGFHHYYEGDLTGWTSDRYMPLIRDEYGSDPDRVPFDFHEIVASFAPRAFLAVAPVEDSNFEVSGVGEVMAAAEAIYQLHGVPERLEAIYPECGHDFPPEAREAAYAWFDRWLAP